MVISNFEQLHIPITDSIVPPRHRLWWYPTGPLIFIPIHSAGPGKGAVDVSQLVISSYVTTLKSLLQVQERSGPIAIRQPKFFSVSQSETLGQSALPETIREVDEVVEVIRLSGWPEEDICVQKQWCIVCCAL